MHGITILLEACLQLILKEDMSIPLQVHKVKSELL